MTEKTAAEYAAENGQLRAQIHLLQSRTAELERVCRAQSERLAALSFEARTLLDGIMVFTEYLRSNADPSEEEYLSIIRRSAQEILNLIRSCVEGSVAAASLVGSMNISSQIPGSSPVLEKSQTLSGNTSQLNPLENKRILVIEDNTLNQVLAKKILLKQNCLVTTVASAEDGIKVLEQSPFDLVLMDIQLPGIDGWSATQIIKTKQNLRHIPIVAMTAMAFPGDEEKCHAAGMDGYVAKPLDTKVLLKTIVDALKR